jgi:ABC-2 type transport system permease protein
MTLVGTLLTALVISREWERGTMEAMMATPVSIYEFLLGKMIPYFVLGIGAMLLCWFVTVVIYQVPFRGSFLALLALSSIFLLSALATGLLISSIAKDQFLAFQIAMSVAYLPSFIMSGFVFEISSMPTPIQWLSNILSARYFVTSLHTIFLAGNIWPLLIFCSICMALLTLVIFAITFIKLKKRLDT